MGIREARLRAMLANNGLAHWELNEEDRDAIQWAFKRIATLEADLAEARKYWHEAIDQYRRLHTTVSRELKDTLKALSN